MFLYRPLITVHYTDSSAVRLWH